MCPDYKVNEKQYTGLERNHISRLVSIDSQFSQCISTHSESAASCFLPHNTAELHFVYHCDILWKTSVSRSIFKTVKIITVGTCVRSGQFNIFKCSQQRHKNKSFLTTLKKQERKQTKAGSRVSLNMLSYIVPLIFEQKSPLSSVGISA